MPQETRNPSHLTLAYVIQRMQERLLTEGQLAPTVIAEGDLARISIRLEPVAPTSEGRAQQMFLLGLMLAQSGEVGVLQQVFFCSEGWMSVRAEGQPLEHRPSEDPQRQEVLFVAQQAIRPPKAETVVFAMKRDTQGRLTALEAFDAQNAQSSEAHSPLLDALVVGFLGSASTLDD